MQRSYLSIAAAFGVIAMSFATTAVAQTADRTLSAAEQAHGIRMYPWTGFISDDGTYSISRHTNEDAFDAALKKHAQQWVQAIEGSKITGLQLDAYGELSVVAGKHDLARQQFAARLATPKLSAQDHAYTLFLATTTFGREPKDAAAMAIAKEYLAKLDALPDSMVIFKYRAHVALGLNYFEADDSKGGIPQLMHAYSLLPVVPFERIRAHGVNVFNPFIPLANMLAGQPDGRAKIDSMGKWVLRFFEPPAAMAKDPLVVAGAQFRRDEFQKLLATVAYLGRQSPPIAGHAWWNTPVPTARSSDDTAARILPLNDGKIRVIEFGDKRCGYCIAALPKMDRLRKELSKNVEVWYVTFGFGTWGADSVNRVQEGKLLHDFYVDHMKLGVSFAVWLGDRVDDVNGGSYPERHPTYRTLGIGGRPWVLITDAQGRVRHLALGCNMDRIRRIVRLLEAERAVASS